MKRIISGNQYLFVAILMIASFAFGSYQTSTSQPSAFCKLNVDIEEQPFFFQDSEPIYYSGRFQSYDKREANSLRVTVTTGGETTVLKETSPSEAGFFELRPSDYPLGYHLLKHDIINASGEILATMQKGFTIVDPEKVEIHTGELSSSEIWRANKVHVVWQSIFIPYGCALTIESGAIVKFCTGASIDISYGGNCIANSVVFTHINDDSIGGDTLNDGFSMSPMDAYAINGNLIYNEETEFRYLSQTEELEGTITYDLRLTRNKTYCVSGTLSIIGCTLTLPPGTILKMGPHASIMVSQGATIEALGNRAAPVIITSINDDTYNGDTNGDGDATIPQPGDWYQIRVAGEANFNYTTILYGSSVENEGCIEADGGKINFNNSVIAHTEYECVNAPSGYFTASNSIFCDSSLAFGYYGSGRVKAFNCVFADLSVAIRQSNKLLVNCIFYRCVNFVDQGGDGSSFRYCCFFNPEGYGDQSYSKTGSEGNIWSDPLFIDPDNGDFRIGDDSPCVDAADTEKAPEYDYYGQPRMDVKHVKDTGTQDKDGICPDIGIYEVPGLLAEPLPDLEVLSVALSGEETNVVSVAVGDMLSVSYLVTNCGPVAVTGSVRDLFQFKGYDASTGGIIVDFGEVEQYYNIGPCSYAEMEATLSVPPLQAGAWKLFVSVNTERDVFEKKLANNSGLSEKVINILTTTIPMGESSAKVKAGETLGFELADLPLSGGMVRIFGDSSYITVIGGIGAMPDFDSTLANGCTTIALEDGSLVVIFPPRSKGEKAYIAIGNSGDGAAEITVEVKGNEIQVFDVSPSSVPNTGNVTLTITGCGLNLESKITLGNLKATTTEVINAAQIAATFNVENASAGIFDLTATAKNGKKSTLKSAVEIYVPKVGSKLRAWLEMPENVRDGRIFTGYVCYANEGDTAVTMPVFKVTCDDSATKIGLATDAISHENPLYLGGISQTTPAGILQPGDEGRLPFYFQPFGTYNIVLKHLNETEIINAYPIFGGIKSYIAAMSEAATRLNLRGRKVYNVHDFVDQALWERNGSDCAAVSGHLIDQKTRKPIGNSEISLIVDNWTNGTFCASAVGKTDENGYFQLKNLADGQYKFILGDGLDFEGASSNPIIVSGQNDINDQIVYAYQGGKISGYIFADDGRPMSYGSVELVDEFGTVVDSMGANGFGAFSFKGISEGVFAVRTVPKDGYTTEMVTNIVINAFSRAVEVDLFMKKGARFGGTVTYNGTVVTNGIVQAIADNGVFYEEACNENGTYLFDGLSAGSYAVRYFTSSEMSDDTNILLYVDDDLTIDFVAKERPLFVPTISIGFGSCKTQFIFTDSDRAKNVTAWAWDFDSDGVIDSREESPVWTYTELGTNTVTLVITEGDKNTTSVYNDCVRVEEPLETILKDNAILFGKNSGTLETVSFDEGHLVLKGDPEEGEMVSGMTIMGNCGEEWFVRRILSVSRFDNQWVLTTEDCELTDIYEQFATAVCVDVEDNSEGPSVFANGKNKSGFFGKKDCFAKVGFKPDVKFVYVEKIKYGQEYTEVGVTGSIKVEGEIGVRGEVGYKTHDEVPSPFKITIPSGIPFVSVESTGVLYGELKASVKGELSVKSSFEPKIQIMMFRFGKGKWTWKQPFPKPEGELKFNADIVGTLESKVGIIPKIGIKVANIKTSLCCDLFVKSKLEGSLNKPMELTVNTGVDLYGEGEIDLWLWKPKAETAKFEGPRYVFASIKGPKPDFDFKPNADLIAPVKVNFINQSEGEHIRLFSFERTFKPVGYEWDFGNGRYSSEMNPSSLFEKEGNYNVYLRALGPNITGPYRVKKTITVGKPEKIPEGSDSEKPGSDWDDDDSKVDTGKVSWDPNEMSGPLGFGNPDTERFVKPGEWLTYTIYFENKSDAEASAQEIYVVNPLSEHLDWSTFEMLDIAFNNQIDTELTGKQSGTSEVPMTGTDYHVRTNLEFDKEKGEVKWYARIVDLATDTGWPSDVMAGILPPNDDTHCGEGHITYRIKVRDDVSGYAVINNSATIVFDYNEPIETDPYWWNKVAKMQKVSVGDETNLTLVVGFPFGDLPIPQERKTWIFVGWFTGPDGTGRLITKDSLVEEGDTELYQYWVRDGHYLDKEDDGNAVADVYCGYVFDPKDHSIKGSVQVKIVTPKNGTAKVSGSVVWAGGMKGDIKEIMVMSNNRITTQLKDGRSITLVFSSNGLTGTLDKFEISGFRNIFLSKDAGDRANADAALLKVKGVYTLAWEEGGGYGFATVSVGEKGKAKATGYLANGAKFSANGQVLLGKEENCVNFVSSSKNVPLAFNLWFCTDRSFAIEGVNGNSFAGRSGYLAPDSSFNCDFLTEPIPIIVTGGKWMNGSSKSISLKLSYKDTRGTFKGSFNFGSDKAVVNGVVVDGVGYGTAISKYSGTKAVIIK